ncbi:hypothetical protein BerOc1_02005 [Pseudodesulfovibrio hydrargyri]|uniref:Uncharacterized protein n=1 Tax=Pseudodesulfovibrio hydrargyri TaxID=2125990 RepID=A0A1J5N382_9BACT|nr:hypothetical protein [Pseudodesulfovibrio hydrargyri]OIQ50075.1 hypothetical protein BerOc1_02005 [Pseudodesulfovibrio hydrargyri]
MFGWNNDAYGGRGFGRGNDGQGRRRRGNGQGMGFGMGRGRSNKGFGRGQGRGQNRAGGGFGGYGQGFGCGQSFGNGFGPSYGQGRMGRGPCGMGLNRFRPGRGGAFRTAMDTADGFGPNAGFCPLCEQHCPLDAPACPKGERYAARVR